MTIQNREYAAFQMADLAEKLEQADSALSQNGRAPGFSPGDKKKGEESQLSKVTRDRYNSFLFSYFLGL